MDHGANLTDVAFDRQWMIWNTFSDTYSSPHADHGTWYDKNSNLVRCDYIGGNSSVTPVPGSLYIDREFVTHIKKDAFRSSFMSTSLADREQGYPSGEFASTTERLLQPLSVPKNRLISKDACRLAVASLALTR